MYLVTTCNLSDLCHALNMFSEANGYQEQCSANQKHAFIAPHPWNCSSHWLLHHLLLQTLVWADDPSFLLLQREVFHASEICNKQDSLIHYTCTFQGLTCNLLLLQREYFMDQRCVTIWNNTSTMKNLKKPVFCRPTKLFAPCTSTIWRSFGKRGRPMERMNRLQWFLALLNCSEENILINYANNMGHI